jgi:hypothetical protein
MGAHVKHTTSECQRFKKKEMEKLNFRSAKKGEKKPNPIKLSFAHLSKKKDKLRRQSRKMTPKMKYIAIAIVTLPWKKEMGWVS